MILKTLSLLLSLFGALALALSVPAQAQAGVDYSLVDGADGVPLLVAEGGTPDGSPILFVHGMSQSHLSWRPQFESELAEKYRLVAFDLRGHGGSGKPWREEDYSASRDVWADDIAAVIAAKNLEDITLVAWSFGGHVAMSYIRKYGTEKVAAIDLSGTVAGLVEYKPVASPENEKILEGSRQRASLDLRDNIEGYLAMLGSFTASPMNEVDRGLAEAAGLMNPSYVRRALTDLPLENTDVAEILNVPVLVSIGTEDPGWPEDVPAMLIERLPNAALSLYTGVGHFPSMEQPERFNTELNDLASGDFARLKGILTLPIALPVTREAVLAKYGSGESRFVEIDGVRMHYREQGDGQVVLLLPGHLGSLYMYDAWVPYLAEEFRVIRLDWPPYGLSVPDPSGDYSSPRGAKLVIGFLDKMGIERAKLIGTSNGATVAAHVAALRPDLVDRLALSTFPLGRPPAREISPLLKEQAGLYMQNVDYWPPSLMRAILEDIFADPSKVTPEIITTYTDLNNFPGGRAAQNIYVKNNIAMYEAGGLPNLYSRITAPTLLQWGDGGIVMPADLAQGSVDILASAPVVLRRYPGSGHMPMIEEPEKTVRDVMDFFDGKLDGEAMKPTE